MFSVDEFNKLYNSLSSGGQLEVVKQVRSLLATLTSKQEEKQMTTKMLDNTTSSETLLLKIVDSLFENINSEELNNILKKYTDFWTGDWTLKCPIVVQVSNWKFNRKGLWLVPDMPGERIAFRNTNIRYKLHFIMNLHEKMIAEITRALLELRRDIHIVCTRPEETT